MKTLLLMLICFILAACTDNYRVIDTHTNKCWIFEATTGRNITQLLDTITRNTPITITVVGSKNDTKISYKDITCVFVDPK